MNEIDLIHWCSLWRAPGVGVKTFYQLVAIFHSPRAFFDASASEVRRLLPHVAEDKWRKWQAAKGCGEQDVAWQAQGEQRYIITIADERYPEQLKTISDAPPIVFVQGKVACLQGQQLGVVGSRNATQPSINTCAAFVHSLTQQGLLITSGLALGIDGAAHQAALDAGGQTVAVVATGLDRVYPAKHRDLAYRIIDNGAIMTEMPIGSGVRGGSFPRRNRLISGLALGVLVVEASVKSGSLITARVAVEQGREVFAIPGSIHNPMARGCHQLIKQGAKLVETADDIMEELAFVTIKKKSSQAEINKINKAESKIHPNPSAQQLLEIMGYEPCHIDELFERSQLTSAEISAMLLELELDGWVSSLAGGLFQRVH